jgi:Ca2+-binding EF-hand superfamily protein
MRTVLCAVVFAAGVWVAFAAGADRDQDGKISREELVAVHASLFEQFDANNDGVVTAAEADPHFMDLADQNRDGKVTKEENNVYADEAAARDLAQCDANGDDVLSGDEVSCITASDSFADQ